MVPVAIGLLCAGSPGSASGVRRTLGARRRATRARSVRYGLAVVTGIAERVAVGVGLIYVRHELAIVAGIADAIWGRIAS